MATLVGDPDLRSALGTQARTRAENRSWRIAVEELVGVHYPETLRRSAMGQAA